MEIIKPSYEIIEPELSLDQNRILRLLERYGRVCYQSKPGETPESGAKFIRGIIDRGHESVIEHLSITIIITCDRGVSHEWVRHRIASYSQESTRYCNYGRKGVRFILPLWMVDAPAEELEDFVRDLETEEALYLKYLKKWADKDTGKERPEKARYWLPQGVKTQLVATHNLREWRHIMRLRTAPAAHPQMRELTIPLLNDFKRSLPIVFEDIKV
jgi:thymidylate synthase (FAD)